MWLRRKEEAGVSEIALDACENKKLQGCWVAVSHDVETEDVGIHDREDGWSGGREEEQCWKRLVVFAHFALFFLASQCSKTTFIYRGERGIPCHY